MRARNFLTTFSSWEDHGFPLALEAAGGSEVMKDPFIELYRRAAGKLSVEWPASPPLQKSLRFGGFYSSPVQTVVRTSLPLYPDCVAELQLRGQNPCLLLLPCRGQKSSLSLKEGESRVNVDSPDGEFANGSYDIEL